MLDALKVGDMIQDNDPRMVGRKLLIFGMTDTRVKAEGFAGRIFWILRSRIYTDGKPRKSGFDRIV